MAAHPLQPRYQNRYADYQIDKQTTQQQPIDATKSHLLDLAAELRNEIYEWTLLTPFGGDDITTDWKPPCLLAACRQLRKETSKLYWQRRIFYFETLDCDGSLHVAWLKAFRWKLADEELEFPGWTGNLMIDFAGNPSGENLLSWLKGLYDLGGYVTDWFGGPWDGGNVPMDQIILGACEILQGGINRKSDWDDVKSDLESMLYALSTYDVDWNDY